MRNHAEREHALHEAIGTVGETLRIDEIGDQPLAHFARAMDASGILLYRYDHEGRVGGFGGPVRHAVAAYSVDLFAEDPVQQALFSIREMPPVVATTRLRTFDPDRYRRSAAYHEFYRPYDMEHLLGSGLTPCAYGSPGMTGILMTRSRWENEFDESDHAVVRAALPFFQAAVRRADRLARETAQPTAAPPPPKFDARDQRIRDLASRHALTAAECEVLALLAEGLSNREIAKRRFVSLETVRTHVQRVLSKLDVPSRTQAAVLVCSGPAGVSTVADAASRGAAA